MAGNADQYQWMDVVLPNGRRFTVNLADIGLDLRRVAVNVMYCTGRFELFRKKQICLALFFFKSSF